MVRRTPDTRDDSHTIADMSGVRRPRPFVLHGSGELTDDGVGAGASDVSSELQGPEERLAVILGTLKAALSIEMVYVVGFGLAIALMLWLWT